MKLVTPRIEKLIFSAISSLQQKIEKEVVWLVDAGYLHFV